MTKIADEIGTTPLGFCRDCCFYEAVDGVTRQGITLPVGGGVCRRTHPASVDAQLDYPDPETMSQPRVGLWPMVNGNDWCGAHPLRYASYLEVLADCRQLLGSLPQKPSPK